jgi:hypothetical protein
MKLILFVDGRFKDAFGLYMAYSRLFTKHHVVNSAIERMKIIHDLENKRNWELFIRIPSKMK